MINFHYKIDKDGFSRLVINQNDWIVSNDAVKVIKFGVSNQINKLLLMKDIDEINRSKV